MGNSARRRIGRAATTVLLAAGVVVAAPRAARASNTFTVNSTADAPDANPGDGVCATAPMPVLRFCTLRAAIMETNADPGLDTVNLGAHTYDLTRTGSGEDAAATGDLDVTGPLKINGNGAVIDGQSADRVFEVFPPGARQLGSVTISNLTIQNGKPPESGYGGGGIFVRANAKLTLSGVTVESNDALAGGGVAAAAATTLTIDASTVHGNAAYVSGSFGGYDGGILSSGSLTITNSTISGNTAVLSAAGIHVTSTLTITGSVVDGNTLTNLNSSSRAAGIEFQGTTLSITGSTVSNNTITAPLGSLGGGIELVSGSGSISGTSVFGNDAFDGGGIAVDGGSGWQLDGDDIHDNSADANAGGLSVNGSSVTATLSGSTVHDNSASFEGGGLIAANGAALTITQSTITGNTAGTSSTTGFGGGIATSFPGATALTVTDSTISDNHATRDGAGVYNGQHATFTNTTFSGNTAERNGGGLYNSAAITNGGTTLTLAGNASLSSATIADNSAGSGGGAFDDAGRPLTLLDTLVAANTGGDCAGTVTSDGHNLDRDSSCALGALGDMSGVDPLLGPLADNGGPTLTQLPAVHSPAIDAGDPAACPAADQRGVARPVDGDLDGSAVCDIGAVEAVPPPDLAVTVTPSATSVVADQTVDDVFDVHDVGPGATSPVTLTVQPAVSEVVVSATPSQGTCAGGAPVTCDLGALAQGGDATVTVTVQPILPGAITATGTADAGVTEVDMANNTTSVTTTVTAAARTRYVVDDDTGFAPGKAKASQGFTVQWDALGSSPTSITDATGMQLFAFGPLAPPSYATFVFRAAGTYAVSDDGGHTATVAVALKSPANAAVGAPFTITWSSVAAPSGFVFDVQIKAPGAHSFTAWRTGSTARSAPFTPTAAGVYELRARLRELAVSGGTCAGAPGDACSAWSPTKKTTVS